MENFFLRVFIQTDCPADRPAASCACRQCACWVGRRNADRRGHVVYEIRGTYAGQKLNTVNSESPRPQGVVPRACVRRGVREVPERAGTMRRATRLIILGAASHVCCGQSLYHRDLDTKISAPGNGGRHHVHARPQAERREAPRPWFVSGGGAEESDDEPHTRWWRSRKRWAKRQAEKKAAEERVTAASSSASQMARKHVIAIQGLLRRLRRLLGIIVDATTLKRLRLLRQARQVRRSAVCFVCSMQSEKDTGQRSNPARAHVTHHVLMTYDIRSPGLSGQAFRLPRQRMQETCMNLSMISPNASMIGNHAIVRFCSKEQ